MYRNGRGGIRAEGMVIGRMAYECRWVAFLPLRCRGQAFVDTRVRHSGEGTANRDLAGGLVGDPSLSAPTPTMAVFARLIASSSFSADQAVRAARTSAARLGRSVRKSPTIPR